MYKMESIYKYLSINIQNIFKYFFSKIPPLIEFLHIRHWNRLPIEFITTNMIF